MRRSPCGTSPGGRRLQRAHTHAHFLNKAELLVEAIDVRVAADVEPPGERPEVTFRDYLTDLNRRFPERFDLRALLLEGATVARNDAAVRERLTAEQVIASAPGCRNTKTHKRPASSTLRSTCAPSC